MLLGLGVFVWSGCDLPEDDDAVSTADAPASTESAAAEPEPAVTEVAEVQVPVEDSRSALDELNINGAVMLGTHKHIDAGSADITRMLNVADKAGDVVQLDFEELNWPVKHDGKAIDGRVYIFWEEGSGVVGGHFDWHAVGQTAKTLENIHDGYLDGKQPPSGAPIWFAILNNDGDECTNVKRSETTW